jgi:alpha-N-arabinofuranosidase
MGKLRKEHGRKKPWKMPYLAVGNESYGCGGRMVAEHYKNLYKQFATFISDYPGNKIFKVASGGWHSERIAWYETLMREALGQLSGIGYHYYTFTDGSANKRTATDFDERGWFLTFKQSFYVEKLIKEMSAVLDKYDPEKRVGIVFDEWGAWYKAEPGSNPRFLYQQNTLRDALLAGVQLNIFNRHCDRVPMANIAQMVNVLQAMILTDKEKMIVTPTYHVFDMYKVHQGATLLRSELACRDYRFEQDKVSALSVSASRDVSGKIHITLCNLDPGKAASIFCEIKGAKPKKISGKF